jgi:hypothetical protein
MNKEILKGGDEMSPTKASPRSTWLLVITLNVAILAACAMIELNAPAEDTLPPSKPAATLVADTAQVITISPRPLSTSTPLLIITLSPSPWPTSTRLPLFGKQVADSQFFKRVERFNLESQDLYSPGEFRSDLDLSQAVDITGFVPMEVSHIPAGYELDKTNVYTKEKSVRQCFINPNLGLGPDLPLLCITQRSMPFQDFVGRNAEIFYLETRDMYFEYVYGGWLCIGKTESGSRMVQWDDRMVPGVLIRYVADGLFMEIGYMGGGCYVEGCLGLSDLISIAEQQG